MTIQTAILVLRTLLCAALLSACSCSLGAVVEGGECEQQSDCAEGLWCLGRVCRDRHRAPETPDTGLACKADCTGKCDGNPDGCGGICTAPCDWMKVPPGGENPPVPDIAAMVYDSRRERLVLSMNRTEDWIEKNETWERGTNGWVKLNPGHQPRDGLVGYAMAYDQARGVSVLFGGSYSENAGGKYVSVDDTWTWNGEDWQLESPLFRPPARNILTMAYDEERKRVVLYGGSRESNLVPESRCLSDTWEWDGREWHLMRTQNSPPCRLGGTTVYDPARKKVIMFGGFEEVCGPYGAPCSYFDDFWEWDGETWAETPSENAGGFLSESMLAAYDADRGKLFFYPRAPNILTAWFGPFVPSPGAWELEGNSFNWIDLPAGEFAGFGWGMAFDDSIRSLVLFGMSRQRLNDTLEWDRSGWRPVQPFASPSARREAQMGFDTRRGVTVLLGGWGDLSKDWGDENDETWEWDGRVWHSRNPVDHPPHASERAMVFDDVRGRMLLYNSGCPLLTGSCGQLWTWDGNAWAPLATAHSPGASSPAMAFDSARDRVVMFTGRDAHTYEFDGHDWQVRRTPANPDGRTGHQMVFDKKREVVVLFGSDTREFRDTWEWNGNVWTKVADGEGPATTGFFRMAYDSSRSRVVLHGEVEDQNGEYSIETWTWDGRTWKRLRTSRLPSARYGFSMAYDSLRDRLVLFGGSPDGRWDLDETWEFGAP